MRDGPDLPMDGQARLVCEELVARLRLGDEVLREYARREGVRVESLSASFVKAVRQKCLDLDWTGVPESHGRPQAFRRARR